MVLLLQPAPGYFAHAVTCRCSPATYHTVTEIKPTTNVRNNHGFCRIKCHMGTYVTHNANVIVTGASDVDDVLVKRLS